MNGIIEVRGVVKDYPLGKLTVRALHGIDLVINRGEFTTIAGPSGSGKTTLLNLIGCVDVPTAGDVIFDGVVTSSLTDAQLTRMRLEKLGFIFQSFNLVPVLTIFQNVELPLLLQGGIDAAARAKRVSAIIERVGLGKYLKHRPNELSGGATPARGHRPRPGVYTQARPRRRAHRQPRLRHRRLDLGLDEGAQPARGYDLRVFDPRRRGHEARHPSRPGPRRPRRRQPGAGG